MSTGGVVIVCGGTGGHLAPGIATAQRLMDAGIAVRLIVSNREVDGRLLQRYPEIHYKRCSGQPFGWRPHKLAAFIAAGARGTVSAFAMLGHRPAVVLAFGGYLTINFVLVARILGIPVVMHEANRIPGRSVRLLADLAHMTFVPDGVSLAGVRPQRIRPLRMPLRREVVHIRKEQARRLLEFSGVGRVLLVAGGSQGAQALNHWVKRHWLKLAAEKIHVIVVTGTGKEGDLSPDTFRHADGTRIQLRVIGFCDAMHELFSCADLVLSRAGAGTIAELTECLAPSILVPYPHAADNHQLANARHFEQRGGCIVVQQSELDNLYQEINDLIFNDWMLDRMRGNLRRMAGSRAAERLADYLRQEFFTSHGKESTEESLFNMETETHVR